MATVDGLTKERMLGIENASITSGLVDTSGNLILYTKGGDPVNAGNVKGSPTIPVGQFPPGTAYYSRIALITGSGASGGAHLQFMLSGLGNYGTDKRGTVLIHLAQRAANTIGFRAWGWGLDEASLGLTLYTRQVTEFGYELWGLFAPFTMQGGALILSNTGGPNTKIIIDGGTTVAPSGLVLQSIKKSDVTSYTELTDKPISWDPLPQDSRVASSLIGAYPLGTSLMLHSPGAGWPVNTYGAIRTERAYNNVTGFGSIQYWNSYFGNTNPEHGIWFREWGYLATVWGPWKEIKTSVEVSAIGNMGPVVGGAYIPFQNIIAEGGLVLTNSTTLTVPKAGIYQINSSQLIAPNGAAYYRLDINSLGVFHAYSQGAMGDMQVNVARKLNAGDTIRFFFNGTTPSSWTEIHSHLSVVKL